MDLWESITSISSHIMHLKQYYGEFHGLHSVRLAYLQIENCRLHQLGYIFVLSFRYWGHNKRNWMRWNNFFSVNILLLHTIFRLLCILPYVIFSIFSLFILRKAPPNIDRFVIYLYMMILAGRYLVKVLFMLSITGSDKTCSVKTACLNHTVK